MRTLIALLALVAAVPAAAEDFIFDTPPFAGTTALTTPGRQVIGNERNISGFSIGEDRFLFDAGVFDVPTNFSFFNGFGADLPGSGANIIVLRDVDADGNPGNGILNNAGTSANLIASRVDTAGAGFFLYFNTALNLNRLVYSTDLSDPTADLKIVARLTDPIGIDAANSLVNFSAGNFAGAVPEPQSWAMMLAGFGAVGIAMRRRQSGPAVLAA